MDTATVGPYRLVQRLGEGGMGVVHLALDPQGRAVALKVLRAHVAADPDARRRLAREVETLRRVRHPRIAEVLDADVVGQLPYLVTRFVPGRTLEAHVRERGPLPVEQLVRVARSLAEALAAIHAAGVVHRDLKPANVMVVDGEPVIIDFGIAHLADESRITVTGLVMGTPGYLSPEVVEGQPVTPATDWWGWGSTVAFAASGRPPFGTGPIEVILDRVRRGVPDLAGVDPRLQPVLAAALTVDPARRAAPGAILGWLGAGRTPPATDRTPAVTGRMPPAGGQDRTVRYPPPAAAAAAAAAARTVRTVPARAPAAPTAGYPGHAPTPTLHYPAPATGGPGRAVAPGPAAGSAPGAGAAAGGQAPSPGAWEPPAGPPPPVRPTGTLALAALALAAVAAVAPGSAAVLAVAAMLVARVVDRSATSLWRRRQAAGRRPGDVPVIVLALPWRALQAAVASLLSMVLPLLIAASVAFIAGTATVRGGTPRPSAPAALALGALAGLGTAWWGPGGGAFRRGSRATARVLTRGTALRVVVWAGLGLTVLAALIVAGHGGPPDWSPFQQPGPSTAFGRG